MPDDRPELRTPCSGPWVVRRHSVDTDDPRTPYARDRDRILHSASFRRLQHKTQVFIVSEGDFYRTRLTHTLEVAQIARSLARWLCLDEDLAEAIALAHDLGHTPFGHAGEEALDAILREAGVEGGWNSNTHSLFVVDELEFDSPSYPGLSLTYATRQGIARHTTPFDVPDNDFDSYPSPTLEAQVVNLADMIAYAGHDVEDALYGGLLDPDYVRDAPDPFRVWAKCLRDAEEEFRAAGYPPESIRHTRDSEVQRRLYQRARRNFINHMIRSAEAETSARIQREGIETFDAAISRPYPLVSCSEGDARQLQQLIGSMVSEVYHSPMVARQNYKEKYMLRELFEALAANELGHMLPPFFRQRFADARDPSARAVEIARFLASLSDRGVIDLYSELYDPRDRAMGRRQG